jgi:hypothetical protein
MTGPTDEPIPEEANEADVVEQAQEADPAGDDDGYPHLAEVDEEDYSDVEDDEEE